MPDAVAVLRSLAVEGCPEGRAFLSCPGGPPRGTALQTWESVLLRDSPVGVPGGLVSLQSDLNPAAVRESGRGAYVVDSREGALMRWEGPYWLRLMELGGASLVRTATGEAVGREQGPAILRGTGLGELMWVEGPERGARGWALKGLVRCWACDGLFPGDSTRAREHVCLCHECMSQGVRTIIRKAKGMVRRCQEQEEELSQYRHEAEKLIALLRGDDGDDLREAIAEAEKATRELRY